MKKKDYLQLRYKEVSDYYNNAINDAEKTNNSIILTAIYTTVQTSIL